LTVHLIEMRPPPYDWSEYEGRRQRCRTLAPFAIAAGVAFIFERQLHLPGYIMIAGLVVLGLWLFSLILLQFATCPRCGEHFQMKPWHFNAYYKPTHRCHHCGLRKGAKDES
jgi:hypothetical protein